MAHTLCMLDEQSYTRPHTCTRPSVRAPTLMRARAHTHTHRQICNTYCFSTERVISRTHLIVTLYVYCLTCFFRPHETVHLISVIARLVADTITTFFKS